MMVVLFGVPDSAAGQGRGMPTKSALRRVGETGAHRKLVIPPSTTGALHCVIAISQGTATDRTGRSLSFSLVVEPGKLRRRLRGEDESLSTDQDLILMIENAQAADDRQTVDARRGSAAGQQGHGAIGTAADANQRGVGVKKEGAASFSGQRNRFPDTFRGLSPEAAHG
jgi:hypothetical protein